MTRFKLAVVVAVLVLANAKASARPPHKRALADHFGPFLAAKLNDCRTCHVHEPGRAADAEVEDKPHNPFGARVKAVKDELRRAGKKADIPARVQAIAEEDSDSDGVGNLAELLTGHFPGEAEDKPTPAELTDLSRTLAAFEKHLRAYPWRPFEVVNRPIVPAVVGTDWPRNPIDVFIAAEHRERGLQPRREAPKTVLLRRLYLDLIGLPPTPEELHAFLADDAPHAYEKVVDRLLGRPEHGERWARHWMDIWRYSDWAGYGAQIRDSQPHVWRWRDWIVDSLNAGKGYDRMVLEMLAGDELAPDDADALRATGYLVRNYKIISRETWMQEVVDHTAQAFLGVTLGCARCHDHMYDPLLQKEYYQVRAIFEPHNVRIDRLPGRLDTTKDGLPRAFDAKPDATTVIYLRGYERTPGKDPLPPGVTDALGGTFPEIKSVPLPPDAYAPDRRAFVIADTVAASKQDIEKTRKGVESARRAAIRVAAALIGADPASATAALAGAVKPIETLAIAELDAVIAETKDWALMTVLRAERLEDAGQQESEDWKLAATAAAEAQRKAALLEAERNVLAAKQVQRTAPAKTRADADKKLAEAEKVLAKAEASAKRAPTTEYTKRPGMIYPATSTGRRLAFARWLAARDNPLTARVAVNHIWLRHFGEGIVPTAFDFGRNGQPPSHPALLDWLAAEFMDSGWNMKHLHRLIVTSSTYRQASTPDATCLARDPDNKYVWRMTPRRVEAEAVRDSVLAVAGALNRAMGGPDLDQKQGLTVFRRSLYFQHAAEKQMEFLKIFDAASVNECYQRRHSIMPQQALALANSELAVKNARLLARKLAATASDAETFVSIAFERVLSRPPTADELSECVGYLRAEEQRLGGAPPGPRRADAGRRGDLAGDNQLPSPDAALRARENLVHVLMNHHEFVTIR